MAKAQEVEQDEFEAAASAEDYVSGYLGSATSEAQDQREYRLIPKGVACKLGIVGFELDTGRDGKAKPRIAIKVEVHEPAEYADGSSNFTVRSSLNPVVAQGKKQSGWNMTESLLGWLYAAANQVSSDEGKEEMVRCVVRDFADMTKDDVPAFHLALVENANEKLKGSIVSTKAIGIDVGQAIKDKPGQKYADKQSFGTLDYPKSNKK